MKNYRRLEGLSCLCAGASVAAMFLGAGLGVVYSDKAKDLMKQNEQKYLDFKTSVEYVEKRNNVVEQIMDSSVDGTKKYMLANMIVQGDEYGQKMYQDSLTSKDREELANNEKEAEDCAAMSNIMVIGGVTMMASGVIGMFHCERARYNIEKHLESKEMDMEM